MSERLYAAPSNRPAIPLDIGTARRKNLQPYQTSPRPLRSRPAIPGIWEETSSKALRPVNQKNRTGRRYNIALDSQVVCDLPSDAGTPLTFAQEYTCRQHRPTAENA